MKLKCVVLLFGFLCACSRPALPPEAAVRVDTTAAEVEDIRIPPPHDRTVADLKEGESACLILLFLQDGTAFVLPSQVIESTPPCFIEAKVWKSGGKLYGKMRHPPTAEAYLSNYVPPGIIRVWLVERP